MYSRALLKPGALYDRTGCEPDLLSKLLDNFNNFSRVKLDFQKVVDSSNGGSGHNEPAEHAIQN